MANLHVASIVGNNGNTYFLNAHRDIQRDIQFLAKEVEEYKRPVTFESVFILSSNLKLCPR